MTEPAAGPRPDPGAEWNRRRRAEKDGLPLPDEFRLFDDEEGIALRFPVALSPVRLGGFASPTAAKATLFLFGFVILGLFIRGDAIVVGIILGAVALVISLPLALLGSLRRVVAIRPEGVEIAWWPVPVFSRRLISRAIVQAFVIRRGGSLDVFPGDPDIRGAQPQYDLWVIRPDGSQEILVGSLQSPEHALYLERWLERRLGIEDAPVAGEYGS